MLKNIFYVIIAILIIVKASATEVLVELKDVDSKDSVMYLSICDEKNFIINNNQKNIKKDCIAGVFIRINSSKIYKFTFNNVPEGSWAIFGYIDENRDENPKETGNLIPKGLIIFSKEIKGEPKFNDIKTDIKGEKQVVQLFVQ